MIHEFALEPELVASWHDRRVAYPFLCQMGLGQRRVACAFPFPAWAKLVMGALQASFAEGGAAEAQRARKNLEVLLRHLQQSGTKRSGRLAEGESWLEAATREHSQYPFGGIVVRTSTRTEPYLVVAERLGEEDFPAWTPPAPPVMRHPRELANALAPVLRCARQLRFVDPYFDVEVAAFFEPMREYLLVAQKRRGVGELLIQVHFEIKPKDIEQAARVQSRRVTEEELARNRLAACERRLQPLLQPGVSARVFAWAEGSGRVRPHNRYVLTEVGGVALLTGLDRSEPGARQTDDLIVLTQEQYAAHWAEYREGGTAYRLIADSRFAGAPPVVADGP
ncbi:hypothetical protein [Pyxidicoccus xibeiensis]|uniref:hypothetical protein n=1 Tax=Pyxidicoccus xibeiensis TaxID=2906759 RepID=UPI0020A70694|nr:hypothetical protein [Pyxidicoccus xibeiensis]MCP3143427.1 hypothetical protein [Pyxidicoccus xibeiensis]